MKEIKYTAFVRTFVIPFYYGSGSATAKSYGSYGSSSGTLNITGAAALANLRRYLYLRNSILTHSSRPECMLSPEYPPPPGCGRISRR
jgi:hypothetical protein